VSPVGNPNAQGGSVMPALAARRFPSSVGPFGYACAPLYASEHVSKQRTLGKEPTGRRSILTSHLVHRLTRKQRTRALTRSNLTVYLIHYRHAYQTVQPNESAAPGAQKAPEVKIQRNVRPANDTSFRKATTGKTTAWNLPDRRF
jgi:hypothetical protein